MRAATLGPTRRARGLSLRRSHDATMHLLVPLWARVPERLRWTVVNILDRSEKLAWCSLVDAALNPSDGPDACDGKLPLPGRTQAGRCATHCDWIGCDHTGTCGCYCGKFQWQGDGTTQRAVRGSGRGQGATNSSCQVLGDQWTANAPQNGSLNQTACLEITIEEEQ